MTEALYKLGVIGCGSMGEAIIKGIVSSKFLTPSEICAYDIKSERLGHFEKIFKITTVKNIKKLVSNSKYILIAVKPQDFNVVINSIKNSFNPEHNIIISIAAGLSTALIKKKLSEKASIIRVMPNTPALLKRGISAVSKGKNVKKEDLEFVLKIFKSLGKYILVDEKFQNTITAISGSGPAYFFLFCKYLVESAYKRGIDKKNAVKLVVETMLGSGEMLKKYNGDADFLIKMVASPGGTTECAIVQFNDKNLKLIIDSAVESAVKRAGEIEKKLNNNEE